MNIQYKTPIILYHISYSASIVFLQVKAILAKGSKEGLKIGSNQSEYAFERERLGDVETQIGIQLEAARNFAGKVKKDLTGMQKSMWEHVKPTPDDLDDIAGIWQLQTDIIREGTKAIFLTNQARKLERMANNPYFARIDFRETGEEHAEKIYIGISNLKNERTGQFLIYDWRAPVSSIFYDYEPGNAGYECPAGRIEGELLLKRQFRIWSGELELMFDSSLAMTRYCRKFWAGAPTAE